MLLSRWWRRRPKAIDSGPGVRVTFFGGKGGVGKTTCSAAHAWTLSEQGRRVLLVSTDPAHSLGDLVQQRLGTRPRTLRPGLAALEVSAAQARQRYFREVRDNLTALASPELRDAAIRQAELSMQAPGAAEAALFEEIVGLILETGADYDELIFDTAPTGHTLQLLTLPDTMNTWAEGLLARREASLEDWPDRSGERRPEDRAAEILRRRRDRFAAARDVLRDPRRTRFVPVLNADALSREETGRMVTALKAEGIAVDTLVINRVTPELAVSSAGDFWQQRKAIEDRHLQAIERDFADLRRVQVPLQAEEIQGLTALKALARALPLDSA